MESNQSRLARFAEEPRRWRLEAQGLQTASRVLRDYWLGAQPGEVSRGEVALPALLLAGYAIENYAKARLVEQGKDWKGHGHDLPWLVKQAGIELNETEEILVQRLKQIVVWAGRYPTPIKPQEFHVPRGEEWPQQAHDSDFEVIEDICERLESGQHFASHELPPTAFDHGQRSPRKQLRKVVALLLAALPRPKRG
jgi:hypothetical protein